MQTEPANETVNDSPTPKEPSEPKEINDSSFLRYRSYEDVLKPLSFKRLFMSLLILAAAVFAYFGATYLQVVYEADRDDYTVSDVAIVLGAAQYDGEPSPVFAKRLEKALELYQKEMVGSIATTGSKQEGDRFTEGISGYVYLLEHGVPDSALIPIVDGADSWQQLSAAKLQMENAGFDSAVLVSDAYHNMRLRAIAKELDMNVTVASSDVAPSTEDYVRETIAVGIGRIVGYRRVSALN